MIGMHYTLSVPATSRKSKQVRAIRFRLKKAVHVWKERGLLWFVVESR
jgi:hypothetical protein